VGRHDAKHLTVVSDDSDLGHPDSLVDSDLWSPLGLPRVEASHAHVWSRCLLARSAFAEKKSIDATRVIEARVQLEANLAWMALIFNVRKQLSSLNDKIVRRRRV